MIDDHDRYECFFWYRLIWIVPDKMQSHKTVVCVCACVHVTDKVCIINANTELNGTGWTKPAHFHNTPLPGYVEEGQQGTRGSLQ